MAIRLNVQAYALLSLLSTQSGSSRSLKRKQKKAGVSFYWCRLVNMQQNFRRLYRSTSCFGQRVAFAGGGRLPAMFVFGSFLESGKSLRGGYGDLSVWPIEQSGGFTKYVK